MTATATASPRLDHMAARVAAIVEHYRTDFTEYDAPHVESIDPREEIVWTVRKMGTHIFTPTSVAAGVAGGWKGWGMAAESAAKEPGEAWYWNGYRWKPIDAAEAKSRVHKWETAAPAETPENFAARHARGGW